MDLEAALAAHDGLPGHTAASCKHCAIIRQGMRGTFTIAQLRERFDDDTKHTLGMPKQWVDAVHAVFDQIEADQKP